MSDALLSKRAASMLVLRCKHCQAPIRVDVSEPPPADSDPKFAPDLDLFDTSLDPEPVISRRVAAKAAAKAPAAAAATDVEIDLSELAERAAPSSVSSAPPLDALLAQASASRVEEDQAEDVEFLLGFRGSPASRPRPLIQGPSLADLSRAVGADASPAFAAMETAPPSSAPNSPRTPESGRQEPAPISIPNIPPSSATPRRGKAAVSFGVALLALTGAVVAVGRLPIESATPQLLAPAPVAAASVEPAPIVDNAPVAASIATLERTGSAALPRAATPHAKVGAHKPAPLTEKRSAGAESASSGASQPAAEPVVAKPEPPLAAVGPFDRAAAAAALDQAQLVAANCRKGGDPVGSANVTVTFAASGRVTSALLNGPPFAGTQTGSCIASALRRARVPAFDGERVTVAKTIWVR